MLSLNKELQEVSEKFKRSIERKLNLSELPKKLENWYQLSYKDFIKELAKKKVKLSLSEEESGSNIFSRTLKSHRI